MAVRRKILSKSAQSVQQVLARKGLAFEVLELSASTRTANNAANTLNRQAMEKSFKYQEGTSCEKYFGIIPVNLI